MTSARVSQGLVYVIHISQATRARSPADSPSALPRSGETVTTTHYCSYEYCSLLPLTSILAFWSYHDIVASYQSLGWLRSLLAELITRGVSSPGLFSERGRTDSSWTAFLRYTSSPCPHSQLHASFVGTPAGLTSRGVVEKERPLPKCFEKHCFAKSQSTWLDSFFLGCTVKECR